MVSSQMGRQFWKCIYSINNFAPLYCHLIIIIGWVIVCYKSSICLLFLLIRKWKKWQWCAHCLAEVLLIFGKFAFVKLFASVYDCFMQGLCMQQYCIKIFLSELVITCIAQLRIDVWSMIVHHKCLVFVNQPFVVVTDPRKAQPSFFWNAVVVPMPPLT